MKNRASIRPYAKWERISAAAVVLVAVVAVSLRHNSSVDDFARTATQQVALPDAPAPEVVTSTTVESPLDQLSPGQAPGFTQVSGLSTDFPGNSLNPSVWATYNGPGNAGVGLRRPSAIAVSNSELTITARGNVSGGISQRQGQLYGRWVIRAKMDQGLGYGPSLLLWPDSEKWPKDGEIDIVELPAGDRSAAVMSAHYGGDNRQLSQSVLGDYSQWHTYGVDWTPNRITFYIDGVERYAITEPAAIPTKSMHLAIQNDVGACSSWIGCRNASTPAAVALHVSSVRVYNYKATN